MIRPTLREDVDEAARLYDQEVAEREHGRRLEMRPGDIAQIAANAAFYRADRMRKARLRLLHRAGLL